jgi:Ca-activated chloride channel family protein
MPELMRCPFCGLLQDEPKGVKDCQRCGGELIFEQKPPIDKRAAYVQVQMELDQVAAPAGVNTERYLLLSIHTPAQVPPEEAAPAGKPRPPLNFASVLDVSGSMGGHKITSAKEAVRQAVRCLHPQDIFSLVTFADKVECPFEPVNVEAHVIAAVESALQEISAGGMTALCGGLEMGIKNALKSRQDSNLVLLLSDGQANVGETDLEKVGQMAARARKKGLLVSTLGVGLDYNEALMTEIATQGGGRFYHITDPNKIPAFVAGELGEVASLAARDSRLTLTIPAGATLLPLSAAYPVEQHGDQAVVTIGDIPCETDLEIPLRLVLLSQKDGARLSVDGTLQFHSPAGNQHSLPVNRVTVRFMDKEAFQYRQGLVQPVAEKVFVQLKAASVLGVARVRSQKPADAEKVTHTVLESLRQYADLLGEERAELEFRAAEQDFAVYAASPASSKRAVYDANRTQRSSKDFDK